MLFILAFLLVLGTAVLFHELGHFIACKLLGVRVEVFSLGYPPKLIGFKKGETEYRISLIPLGGYVKITGQEPDAQLTGAPYEYGSRPPEQRMFIVFLGPLFNILVAFLIFFLLGTIGTKFSTFSNVIGEVEPELATITNLQPKDEIIAVDGKKVSNWFEFINELYGQSFPSKKTITYLRNGKEYTTQITIASNTAELGIYPFVPELEIEMIVPNRPAQRAGLKQGDKILAITNVDGATTFRKIIDTIHNSPGKELTLLVQRNDTTFTVNVVPELDSENNWGIIGFTPKLPVEVTMRYSPLKASLKAFETMIFITSQVSKYVYNVLLRKIPMSRAFGGIQAIAYVAGQQARRGWIYLLNLIGFISLQLGIINLLPIPILDGGHILVLGIEKIRGRPISAKKIEIATKIGFVILATLMAYIIVNDLVSSGTIARVSTLIRQIKR